MKHPKSLKNVTMLETSVAPMITAYTSASAGDWATIARVFDQVFMQRTLIIIALPEELFLHLRHLAQSESEYTSTTSVEFCMSIFHTSRGLPFRNCFCASIVSSSRWLDLTSPRTPPWWRTECPGGQMRGCNTSEAGGVNFLDGLVVLAIDLPWAIYAKHRRLTGNPDAQLLNY